MRKSSHELSGEKVLRHSVFNIFPQNNLCVDIELRFLSVSKAEKVPLRQKKYVVTITFFLNFAADPK